MKKITDRLLHGGDYNPEQWLDKPDILAMDIEYFKKAGINTVTLGVFSWAKLEPEEGRYDFEWLEEIIDNLHRNGISVIMATPSGARPKWMADRYEEVLRVDAQRRRALFGGRHNHCYTSPVYREKIRLINTELVKRFGSHPAVILWHISNEFGGECHCPLCQEAFREWLKKRYGTIDKLNDCWCTTFWSHIYSSFDEIESPSPLGESMLHGLNLDWKRFVTDRTVDFAEWEIRAIREAGSEKPVTANLMYDFTGLNYGKFKEVIDVVSWDNYPTWHKGPEALTALDCGMQHDRMRSIGGKPFLLMESCPSSTNWQSVSKLKRPGMLLLSSLQAVAHGSDSVLYFQMRQSRGASEKLHGAVIDHYGGSDTRVFQEVCEVGAALEQLSETAGTRINAKAAILWDTESRWAMEDSQGPRNAGLHGKEQVLDCYRALRSFGLDVDVIDMEQELSGYRLVIAPMAYSFRAGISEKIRAFVQQGGTLVMTYWSGVVDEYDRCFLGKTPAGLTEVLGLRFAEIDGLYDGEMNTLIPVEGNEEGIGTEYECRYLCELVETDTARTVMTYGNDFYAGYPAVTCNTYGEGRAYYVCAHVGSDFYRELLRQTVEAAFPDRPVKTVPEGLFVNVREREGIKYIFLQNFNQEAVNAKVEWTGCECIYGLREQMNGWDKIFDNGDVSVNGLGTVVLKVER